MAVPFSLVVYDSNVFDTTIFDTTEMTPVIVKLAVPKEMRVVALGTTVPIFAHIYSYSASSETAIPMNLVTLPEIQVYDPYDFSPIDFAPMVAVDDGVYRYQYDVANNARYGVYSARVRAVNGSRVTISKQAVIFTVPLS